VFSPPRACLLIPTSHNPSVELSTGVRLLNLPPVAALFKCTGVPFTVCSELSPVRGWPIRLAAIGAARLLSHRGRCKPTSNRHINDPDRTHAHVHSPSLQVLLDCGETWIIPRRLSTRYILLPPNASTALKSHEASPVEHCASPGRKA
jgi:hypothetical protein